MCSASHSRSQSITIHHKHNPSQFIAIHHNPSQSHRNRATGAVRCPCPPATRTATRSTPAPSVALSPPVPMTVHALAVDYRATAAHWGTQAPSVAPSPSPVLPSPVPRGAFEPEPPLPSIGVQCISQESPPLAICFSTNSSKPISPEPSGSASFIIFEISAGVFWTLISLSSWLSSHDASASNLSNTSLNDLRSTIAMRKGFWLFGDSKVKSQKYYFSPHRPLRARARSRSQRSGG